MATNPNPTAPAYGLKNPLALSSLPSAQRDAELKLAWTNSVCILFLIIGLAGARRGIIAIRPAPPLQEIVPVVVAPQMLPPQETVQQKPEDESKNDAPAVNVVIPQMPNITFSVPTVGTLVASASLASAPPLEPLRTQARISLLNSTGGGGDRPEPPYPPIAKQTGEQGTVVLLLTGDDAGNIVSVEVKNSSGFPVLDRASSDFIKRHWRLPAGAGKFFQTSITYQLQF
jgi:TonB family protein